MIINLYPRGDDPVNRRRRDAFSFALENFLMLGQTSTTYEARDVTWTVTSKRIDENTQHYALATAGINEFVGANVDAVEVRKYARIPMCGDMHVLTMNGSPFLVYFRKPKALLVSCDNGDRIHYDYAECVNIVGTRLFNYGTNETQGLCGMVTGCGNVLNLKLRDVSPFGEVMYMSSGLYKKDGGEHCAIPSSVILYDVNLNRSDNPCRLFPKPEHDTGKIPSSHFIDGVDVGLW